MQRPTDRSLFLHPRPRPWTRSRLFSLLFLFALFVQAIVPARAQAGTPAETADLPSNIFDRNSVGWASVRNFTSAAYATYFDTMKAAGFMVTDIEVDVINNVDRVGAVWQKNVDSRGWAQLRNLTHDEFSTVWQEYKDDGYRLIDQETYVLNGTRYWAGVWVENKESYGWASYRNQTSAEFAETFRTLRDRGFMIIDIEAYEVGGGTSVPTLRYASAWVANAEQLAWNEHRDLTSEQFGAKFDEYKATFRMIDVESYQTAAGQRYAGIWVENKNGRGWSEYRNMTSQEFGNKWLQLRDAGYRLIDYEVYPTANGWRYAGIWRQNSERPTWSLKDEVDALASAHVAEFNVPGMSIAIAQNGQWRYLRGFGFADIDDNKVAHSGTIYPLASVSKGIAGVLAERLDQQGMINLDIPTFLYVPGSPIHHMFHTVRQTTTMRAGMGHYGSYSGQGFDPPYTNAQDAVEDTDHVPLAVPTGSYKYSTFSYNWTAAAIETATGLTIHNAFNTHLRNPFSLNTLRSMTGAPASPHRATGYNSLNQEVAPHETSHKTLGGGLEGSAYDVARMGIKLMDGQILNAVSLAEVWTPPDVTSNYGMGWVVDTEQGTQRIRKSGAQTGAKSYMILYPEEDIVIVVLTNRKTGGHSPGTVALAIGDLMLDELAAASMGGAAVESASLVPAALEAIAAPLATGDFDEPLEEALDPDDIVFPKITNPGQPDPDLDEPEDEALLTALAPVFLPIVKK